MSDVLMFLVEIQDRVKSIIFPIILFKAGCFFPFSLLLILFYHKYFVFAPSQQIIVEKVNTYTGFPQRWCGLCKFEALSSLIVDLIGDAVAQRDSSVKKFLTPPTLT